MSIANLNTGQFIAFHPETGKPLALGRVFFYEPGTVTPKAVYTTRAANVQHPSPLILSATGTARVFMDGEYDIRIEDANGVLVQTLANVFGALDQGSVQEAIDAAVSAVSFGFGTQTVTSSTTLATSAAGKLVLVDATSGNVTVTLPAAAGMAESAPIKILRTDASGNTVTIDGNASETINGAETVTLGVGGLIELTSDASNWRISGQITRAALFTSGTINGAVIGGTTPAAGTFTDLRVESNSPTLDLVDANGGTNTKHERIEVNSNQMAFLTFNDAEDTTVVDYAMAKGASGATSHSFKIEGSDRLVINASGITTATAVVAPEGYFTLVQLQNGGKIATPIGFGSPLTDIGDVVNRFRFIYLENAPVVVSDFRLKENIRDLNEAERAAAAKIKARTFTMKDGGQRKVGYVAQEVIEAMASEGLCAFEYGLVTDGEVYGVDMDAINAFRMGASA